MADADVITKRCTKCGCSKPATHDNYCKDSKAKDGLFYWCKICAAAHHKAYYGANRKKIIARAIEQVRKRRIENPEYDRRISRECKRRQLADPAEYEKHLARGREWNKANPDKVKQFTHMAPDKRCARAMVRYASKTSATPPWADLDAVAAVYAECRRITEATGIEHEVDHIIPLRGRTVCGLHVHWNLRVIPAEENHRKGNRLVPEALGLVA